MANDDVVDDDVDHHERGLFGALPFHLARPGLRPSQAASVRWSSFVSFRCCYRHRVSVTRHCCNAWRDSNRCRCCCAAAPRPPSEPPQTHSRHNSQSNVGELKSIQPNAYVWHTSHRTVQEGHIQRGAVEDHGGRDHHDASHDEQAAAGRKCK